VRILGLLGLVVSGKEHLEVTLGSAGTVQELLKVDVPASAKMANYLSPDTIAYYAQWGLDETFALSMVPDWVIARGAFSPLPLQPEPAEIAQFFVNDKLDYDLMV
jgi:hypothetical protein